MKKIEPFMWVIFDDDGDYETNSVNEFSCGRSGGKPLYTREALEAAVNAAVANCELVTGARFTVDAAAIINQLTGE